MELWGYFVIIAMFLVFAYLAIGIIKTGIFNHRIFQCRGKEEHDPYFVHFEDYSDMVRTEYEMSYKGKTIRGYIYAKQHFQDSKGLFILAHGMFSTHLNYLPDIALLISCGYEVLAFDQYGVGISDGEEIISLEHGTRVLNEIIFDDFSVMFYFHMLGLDLSEALHSLQDICGMTEGILHILIC